jgi:putative spermidine/putrescine transport system ATP-binding protein
MTRLVIEGLVKQFGAVQALKSIDLEIAPGELISLLGPSGCGKTTTLRCVAGFEYADAGRVCFDGLDVSTLPPERRDIGMVFQNYALFPHLTVGQNLAFGLEMRRVGRDAIRTRVQDALRMVQLEAMSERYPRQLSGGQQQRVALARALVIEPRVLLLDEPLANLDATLREEMRFFIRDLQQRVGITTLYVTHDQSEAMVMSDRIVVMFDGRIAQIGPPREIYAQPASRTVAQFIGRTQLIPGTVVERRGDHRVDFESPLGRLTAPGARSLTAGTRALLAVRPEAIHLEPGPIESDREAIACRVSRQYFLGGTVDHVLECAGDLTLTAQTAPAQSLEPGSPGHFTIDPAQVWVLPDGQS